jgi:hypothetical protein
VRKIGKPNDRGVQDDVKLMQNIDRRIALRISLKGFQHTLPQAHNNIVRMVTCWRHKRLKEGRGRMTLIARANFALELPI